MIKTFSLFLAKILVIALVVALGSILLLPSQTQAATSTSVTANLTLVAKDVQGQKVTNVNFGVYQQLQDINNNPVLGNKLAGGTIGDLGSATVSLKNNTGITLPLAIVYYQLNNDYGKFYLYNQTITGSDSKVINLPFSGVTISVADPNGNIQSNYNFDLYVVLNDSLGNQIGTKKVLSSNTGDLGQQKFYLVPNDYFITFRYLDPSDPEALASKFSILPTSMINFRYKLGAFNVSFSNSPANNTNATNFSYSIYKLRNGSYFSVGSFSVDLNQTKSVLLPAGDYKMTSGSNVQDYEFVITPGVVNSFSYFQGAFHFRVTDALNNPEPALAVSIYKYQNNSIGAKIYSGKTDANGEVITPLASGNYIANIDTSINNQKYQSRVFYVQPGYDTTYQFLISSARIYLTDNLGNNLTNQKFYLYNYGTDSAGNVITGNEIGNYTTNNLGYVDINLVSGRYIVKPVNATKIFPISVDVEKLNTFYLQTVIKPVPTPNPEVAQPVKTITTPKTSTVYMAVYTNSDLYNKDSDHDGLSDFEEMYIWHTNPYKADSDSDGYNDNIEIPNGYNPNGPGRISYTIWAYNKPRVSDLRVEQTEAAYLKAQLTKKMGKTPKLSVDSWNTYIKAFVYGGYSIAEIQHDIIHGPSQVSPIYAAYLWRAMRTQ